MRWTSVSWCCGPSPGSSLMRSMKRLAITGTTVRAHSSEASSANVTVSANGRKNWLTMPPTKPSGRKTATVVKRGAGDRAGDLTRAGDDRLAHWVAPAAMPVDVLEDDDGVVDDPADGDRQPAQGHDVDRDAGNEHERKRGHDRDGNADGGDQRGPQAHQEEEDRQDREERAEAALAHEAVARLDDEGREVLNRGVGEGAGLGQLVETLLDALDHVDGVGVAGLGHGENQRGLAVELGVARRLDVHEIDRAQLAQAYRRRSAGSSRGRHLDRHDEAGDLFLGRELVLGRDRDREIALRHRTGREDHVVVLEETLDLVDRDACRGHLGRVQADQEAALRWRRSDPRH